MATSAPPHNLDAERAVLGAILRQPENLGLIADTLTVEHFFADIHHKIFGAMLELYNNSHPSDFLTVADKLRHLYEDSEYLGPQYLVELSEQCPVSENVEYYAKIVREYYYLRRVIHQCQDTIKKAMACDGGSGNISGFMDLIEKEFLAIANAQDTRGVMLARDVLIQTLDELESRFKADGVTGCSSGFRDIDGLTGGWQKSDLIIIAARPAMGKTAFVLNCVLNAVRAGNPAIMFTLEMARTQLMLRIMSSVGRVDASKMRRGLAGDDDQDRLMYAAREVDKLKGAFGIDETPGITLTELRSRCRRFQREHGLGLIAIDYLQLMTGSTNRRNESREREISEISMGLKALAKELNVPILALAQLNRGPDSRPDKRPKLSDLRESGSMEQDADQIIFLYRDEYYNKESEHVGKAEVIFAKNRHGPTDTVFLAFQPNFVSFYNLAAE